MMRTRLLAAALLATAALPAWAGTTQEAQSAGAAAAASMATITDQPARDATPGYTTSPSQTSLNGSQAQRDSAADAQASACASATQPSTECEALMTVRQDESLRQVQPSMENDPQVLAAQSAGTPSGAFGAGYSGCTPQTQPVGKVTYDIQSCHDYYLRVLEQQCTKTLEVTVTWSCKAGADGTFRYPNGDYYCTREITNYFPSCNADETMVGSGQFSQCEDVNGVLRPADMTTETEVKEEAAVPTVKDTWINPCADMESRVPDGLLLADGDNTVPSGGAPNGMFEKCERVYSVCTDVFPQSRVINRLLVTRQCWAYTNTFNCVDRDVRSDCGQPRFGDCKLAAERCEDYDAFDFSICTLWTKDYSCVTSDTRRNETVMSCAGQTYTDNSGNTWNTGYPRNGDFAQVVSIMEAARQAGKYNQDQAALFSGFDNRCRKKLFGLVNCCNRAGSGASAFNNLSLAMQAGLRGPSPYVFDGLFGSDSPDFVKRGFSVAFGGDETNVTAFFSGDFSVENVVSTLSPSFWVAAATSLSAASLLSCSEKEKELAMKRDAGLCDDRGSYCSKKLGIIKTCVERTQTYCCFNSILARLINRQGKAQLGQSLGGAKNPNCGGFTAGELQRLDLARMDLSEFYDSITTKPLDQAGTSSRVNVTDCYFGDGQCAASRSTP